jgi:predicted DNA-binding ribbon-helix-helix protein
MVDKSEKTRTIMPPTEEMMETRLLAVGEIYIKLRLENSYWDALKDICFREKITIEEVIEQIIYSLKLQKVFLSSTGRPTNASVIANSLRIFIIGYFRQAATETGHRQAGHGNVAVFLSYQSGAATPEE